MITSAHARLEALIRKLDVHDLREIVCLYLNENTVPQDLVFFAGKAVETIDARHLWSEATLIRLALWDECE